MATREFLAGLVLVGTVITSCDSNRPAASSTPPNEPGAPILPTPEATKTNFEVNLPPINNYLPDVKLRLDTPGKPPFYITHFEAFRDEPNDEVYFLAGSEGRPINSTVRVMRYKYFNIDFAQLSQEDLANDSNWEMTKELGADRYDGLFNWETNEGTVDHPVWYTDQGQKNGQYLFRFEVRPAEVTEDPIKGIEDVWDDPRVLRGYLTYDLQKAS